MDAIALHADDRTSSFSFSLSKFRPANRYMDAIALHAAGVEHAVACLGTAVTENQLLAAAALSPSRTVYLCLDGDEARP